MSEPSFALQKGVFAALGSSGEVSALVGTRIFDRVTPNAGFPYIRIGNDQVLNEDQDCVGECVEVFSTIDVFSRAEGKREAKNVAGAIVRTLNENTISIEGAYALLQFVHQETRFLDDPDGLSTHAVLTFHALIDGART
jgi:hypothetical protein